MSKFDEEIVVINVHLSLKLRDKFHLFAKRPDINSDATKLIRGFMQLCTGEKIDEKMKKDIKSTILKA